MVLRPPSNSVSILFLLILIGVNVNFGEAFGLGLAETDEDPSPLPQISGIGRDPAGLSSSGVGNIFNSVADESAWAEERKETITEAVRRVINLCNDGKEMQARRVLQMSMRKYSGEVLLFLAAAYIEYYNEDFEAADRALDEYMKNGGKFHPVVMELWLRVLIAEGDWSKASLMMQSAPKRQSGIVLNRIYADLIESGQNGGRIVFKHSANMRLPVAGSTLLASFLDQNSAPLIRHFGNDGFNEICAHALGPDSVGNLKCISLGLKRMQTAMRAGRKPEELIGLLYELRDEGCLVPALEDALCRLLYMEKRFDEYQKMLGHIMSKREISPFLKLQYAQFLLNEKCFEKAEPLLKELSDAYPNRKYFHLMHAGASFNAGRMDAGFPSLRKAARMAPEMVEDWMTINTDEPEMKLVLADPRFAGIIELLNAEEGAADSVGSPSWMRVFLPPLGGLILLSLGIFYCRKLVREEKSLRRKYRRRRKSR